MDHIKDPERVRLGRLGALTTHARGHTNVAAARAAWEDALAAEFGIGLDIDPHERTRRMGAAMRVRMSRIAAARWGNRKGAAAGQNAAAPAPMGGTRDADRSTS